MAYMYFPTLWQIRIASYLIPRAVFMHQCSITYDHYGEQRTHTIYCEIPPTNHRNTDDTTTSSEVSAKRMRRWLYTVKKHKQNKKIKKEKENFSSNFTREQAPVATQTHRLFFGRDVEVVKSFHDLAIVRLLIILTNVFACS